MNLDLKPFYETAHRIYQELLHIDTLSYESVFNPSLLHENQFRNLIDVLSKVGFIKEKVISPGEKYLISIDGIAKGEKFLNFENWIPKDTSVLNPNRNEYYLFYVEYDKRILKQFSFPHQPKNNSETIFVLSQVYTNSEIFNILLGINKGGRNFIQSRNQNFPPVLPTKVLIYDLTNLAGYTTKYTREGFQDLLNKATSGLDEIDESFLSRIGENVTSKLGYNLEDIKLPYFETYYRLTYFFPEFETLLLNELNFPNRNKKKGSIKSQTKKVKSKVNTSSEVNGILEERESETDEHRTLFKYGIYFPTIRDNQIDPCFKVKTVASVFASHISRLQEETGQMVGIFGKWGRGKTYFKKEVEEIFENEKSKYNFTIIDFHAWKYQDTPAIWAYLYERLSEKYFESGWFCRCWRKLKLNFLREKSNVITDILFLGILWSLFTGILSLLKLGDSSLIGTTKKEVKLNQKHLNSMI